VLLVEVAQDVALVFLVIGAANEKVLTVTGEHLRVMARRDGVKTEARSSLEQQIELDVSIAFNARIRRLPRRVSRDKGRHHVALELLGVVKDVVVDAEHLGDAARVVDVDHVPEDEMILDIGPKSIAAVEKVLGEIKTLVWNGPFGAFETPPFDKATMAIARTAARLTKQGKLTSVAGGGDTVAALNEAKVADDLTYVSTAGGAFLEWMEGKALPGVEALRAK